MTKDKALRLALEALVLWDGRRRLRVIAAIKEALDVPDTNFGNIAAQPAQPAQEPVAINWDAVHEKLCDVWRHDLSADEGLDEIQDLIATPPAAVMGIPTTGDYAMGYAEGFNDACKRPAQEPDIYPEEARELGLEALAYYTTPPAAQPAQEHNFCSRCGKRTADLTVIHTCTPPQRTKQCWKCGDMDAAFQDKCDVPACGMKEQP